MLDKFAKQLNAGTGSLVILALLHHAGRPLYGYQIAKALEKLGPSGGPAVKQGTLYPVLRALEKNGLLTSRVEPSVSGPPRRYYAISENGTSQLAAWRTLWEETRDFVDTILAGSNVDLPEEP